MAKNERRISAREVAIDLLLAVEKDDAYANLLLPKLLEKARLDSRDTAFAQLIHWLSTGLSTGFWF